MNFSSLANLRPFIATLLACSLLSGCTTTNTLGSHQLGSLTADVKAGDNVDCTLRDNSHARFKVVAITPDVLLGDTHRVPVDDIRRIDITRYDGRKTGLLVGGIALVALAAGAIAVAESGWGTWTLGAR